MTYQQYRDDQAYTRDYDVGREDESSGSSLRDYIEIAFRRKLIIAGFFVFAVIAILIYTFTRIPLYESSATIEIGVPSVLGKQSGPFMGPKQRIEKEIGILKSRGLAEEYVSRIEATPEQLRVPNLQLLAHIRLNDGNVTVKAGKDIHEVLSQKEMDLTPQQSGLAGTLTSMISVIPDKGNQNFLRVNVRADNPELARTVLRNYVRLYLELNLERARRESKQAANWLKEELEKSEEKLRESQSNLFVFNLENGIVGDDEKGKSFSFSSLSRRFEGLEQSKQAQTKMQALKQHDGKMLPQGLGNEYIGKLKQDIALMESEYAQMQGVYSPNYPKMTLLRQKIKFLQDKIGDMEKQVVESSLQVARTEQGLLEESFEKAKGETDRVKSLEAHYTLLRKDVETNTEFHKILLKEYKEIDIKARTIPNNAQLIDSPTLPGSPAWPPKTLFVLVGALAGLLGGFGIAVLVDRLDSTVQSPLNIERQFGVRKLGLVPNAGKPGSSRALPGDDSALALAAYNYPRTPMSDSIKNIHTSIYFSHLENPAQKIMLTSAAPGEGKTTISVSMATILTSEGDRSVVLIDCDLRRPKIHKLLGNGHFPKGLTDYITDQSMEIAEVLIDHDIKGLSYIPAGSIQGDPVKLLGSSRMKELVQKLSEQFDYVVMDAPPTLGFPDSLVVSSYSDGVVFVVKHASSSRHEVTEALQALRSTNGTRILGVVMNQFNAPSAYGYKYRYGGYYYRNQKYYSNKETKA